MNVPAFCTDIFFFRGLYKVLLICVYDWTKVFWNCYKTASTTNSVLNVLVLNIKPDEG
jgi:hypothetical protein